MPENADGSKPQTDAAFDSDMDTGVSDTLAPRETAPSTPAKVVGNITTRERIDTNGLVFSDYWDQLTPENAGIWGNVQKIPGGTFNWAALDAMYKYTVEKGIAFAENCFVWGSLQPGQPTGTLGESDVKAWMQGFCERYPQTKMIEVVCEPPPHSKPYYADNIGGGTNGDWAWIANSFRWARQACPNATLVLSDFGILEKADETLHFIDIVKTLQATGAPVDAIGAELFNAVKVGTGSIATSLATLHAETGLPVYIAGYRVDAKDDQQQLQIYQSHFSVFWQADYVPGIRVEGWIYDEGLSPPGIGLVRAGTSRPAMKWLMDLMGRPAP